MLPEEGNKGGRGEMKQSKKTKLSDLVKVESRFARSVNLERDFYAQTSLDGFILTTTGRMALYRFAESFAAENSSRAWTLTGPFGSGKSTFALFLAKVFGFAPKAPDVRAARELLRQIDEALWQNLFGGRRKNSVGKSGFLPVLVSGSRESLAVALLRGLKTTLENFDEFNSLFFKSKIEELLNAGEDVKSRQIVELLIEVSKHAATGKAKGLLIVVDELGKLLEYAAHRRDGDIFLLQELAEATKKGGEHSIFLLTILHQAFENYIERLGRGQQDEWMKIQGRFEDIAFLEPTEQILRLVNQAIRAEPEIFQDSGRELSQKSLKLGLADWLKAEDANEILVGCLPLHPTVALIVGHLFRRVAQNERSLFAFLTSAEPFGFQDFLSQTELGGKRPPPLFRLNNLYDYVTNALGGALYARANGRKWAEIEAVLNRMNDASPLEIKLVKAIGLLQAVGDLGSLKPSREVLNFAFDDEKSGALENALERLKTNSLIIYRHYNRAFGLWEGSDIDLDERVGEARSHTDANESLAESLSRHFKPRPLVAKRHYSQKGTLRFFDVRYASAADFEARTNEPLAEADGRILYAIALNDEEIKELVSRARSERLHQLSQILIAVPPQPANLRDAVTEVACLRWVKDNTPGLEADRVASRELQSRLAEAENRVREWLEILQGASAAENESSAENCLWFYRGERIEIESPRALQERLSAICDKVFDKTPTLRNELINRRELSSSAASARKSLIEAMLARAAEPKLGIEGFPPQMSMYFSVLQETGIHRADGENERWGFYAPKAEADEGIKAVWNEIDAFLSETEVERQTVADLFARLSRPPFGLKSGVLPVLLFAALLHYDTEVALYEQGSFVPALSVPVFERLTKSPETFGLQRCRIAGVRALVFEQFAEVLDLKSKAKEANLLEIVRGLTRFALNLPEYTRRTQTLSPNAARVRQALFETREPDKLLFHQLPEACGFAPFTSDGAEDEATIDKFFKTLRESLAELQRKYDDLLGELERLLIAAFALKSAGGAEAREEIERRAFPLLELTVEPKLKSLIIRLVNQDLDLSGWIESIAAFLANKPPDAWNDSDLARCEISLAELRRSFLHIEALAFEMGKYEFDPGREVIRLGVTTVNEPERQRVLTIGEPEKVLIEEAKQAVDKAFQSVNINGNRELRLAVLAKISQELLNDLENLPDEQVQTVFKSFRAASAA
jgi:hypothetical protein